MTLRDFLVQKVTADVHVPITRVHAGDFLPVEVTYAYAFGERHWRAFAGLIARLADVELVIGASTTAAQQGALSQDRVVPWPVWLTNFEINGAGGRIAGYSPWGFVEIADRAPGPVEATVRWRLQIVDSDGQLVLDDRRSQSASLVVLDADTAVVERVHDMEAWRELVDVQLMFGPNVRATDGQAYGGVDFGVYVDHGQVLPTTCAYRVTARDAKGGVWELGVVAGRGGGSSLNRVSVSTDWFTMPDVVDVVFAPDPGWADRERFADSILGIGIIIRDFKVARKDVRISVLDLVPLADLAEPLDGDKLREDE